MKAINIILLFQFIAFIVEAANFLLERQWQDAPHTGWGTEIIQCSGQLIEANGRDLLALSSTQNKVSKTWTGLKTHYKILFRIDYVVVDNWSGQSISFLVDGVSIKTYSYSSSPSRALSICGSKSDKDTFERLQFEVNHFSSTLKFEVVYSGGSGRTVALLDLQVYLDTCNDDCKACTGPNQNQCSSCNAPATLSSGKCVCPAGQYIWQSNCQSTCTGNLRVNAANNACEEILCKKSNCVTCAADNYSCSKCTGSLKRYQGGCITSCPSYTENVSGECIDITSKYWNGKILFKGFQEDDFSSFSFNNYGFSMSPLAAAESSISDGDWARFSDCSDNSVTKRFYGGFGIYGQSVSISKTFNIVDELGQPIKHSSILVKFYYLQAENYEKLSNGDDEELIIKIDGIKKQSLIQGGTEMGCGRLDQGENYGWIVANSTSTNSSNSFTLTIENNFKDPAWYEGFGLREMVVIVERCVSNCIECGDYDGCVKCDTGYYLWRAQCYKDKCPDGAYHDTTITSRKVCGDCHPTCLTCSGPNFNECIKCQDPRLFKANQCLLDCGQGFYPDKPDCKPCNSECYYCDGPTNTDCKKCTGNRYFYKLTKQCLLDCPDTFYENASTNICDPCNSKCLTCNGPSENQCLSCPPPSKFLFSNKCDSACPYGMYGDKSDQICKPCVAPCATCVDTPTQCTSCTIGLFLDGYNCKPTCPPRFYGNTVSQVCEKCHVQCARCKGATPFDCQSCDDEDGYFDPTKNQCVSQCPIKYYGTKETGEPICKDCYFACTECKSPGDKFSCTRCSGSRYLTYNNSCEEECPPHYYKDTSNFICKACHPSCLTCNNDSSTGCLSCITGRYLNEKMCLERCPDSTFPDNAKGKCFPCHPSCATCDGDLYNNCNSCQLGKYLQDRTCSEKCKDGYYPDMGTLKCKECHATCATCYDGSESSCLSCKTTLYLSNNKCGSVCPDGFFQNQLTLLCDACPYTCKTCIGINNDKCLSCSGNRYLVKPGMKCESYCPQGFYPNSKTNECDMCSLQCKNCSGPNDDNCKECSAGTYLYQNKCISSCPSGYFATEQPNICNPCHYTCDTCSGSLENQCVTCTGNRYYLPHNCLTECPDKYFGNQVTHTCDKCDSSCRTCFGVNNNNCLSCYDDKLLLNYSCVDSCPDGYVRSIDNSQCLLCGSTCETCSPTKLDTCLTCKKGWYMHSNKCYQTCPQGTYPGSKKEVKESDGTTYEILICKNCIFDCIVCTGQTEQECQVWQPQIEEQNTDKIIFWIFIGKSAFCTFCFFFGFYLDYRAEKQKPQVDDQKQEYDMVDNEIMSPQKSSIFQQRQPLTRGTPLRDSRRNPSVVPLNLIQPHGTPQNNDGFDGYNPNITAQRLDVTEENSPDAFPKRTQKRGFSLIRQAIMQNKMLSLQGNIKTRSDKEIKDLIAPQGGTGDFLINAPDGTQSNKNVSPGDNSMMQRTLTKMNSRTIEGMSNTNLFNQTTTTVNSGFKRMGTYSNMNTTSQSQLKGFYDPKTNTFTQIPNQAYTKRQLPDKSFLYFLITFFEFTSLLFYYNKYLIRPLRALIYYCKLLFLFWLTSRYLNLLTPIVICLLIGLQLVMVGIERFVGFLASSAQKTIAIIFTLFVILILYNIVWFFTPELKIINYEEDFDWSILYLITFGADLIAIQIIFLSVQYWYTRKNIFNDLTKDRIHRILKATLYNQKFAEWMKR